MKEYSQIINKDEKVLWEDRPQFAPFLAKSFIAVPFGLFFLSFALFWTFLSFSATSDSSSTPQTLNIFPLFGVPFILIGLGITLSPLYSVFVYKNIYYILTDKRVIIQGGLIGRDFEIVDFDKIQSANVNVGIFDKLFGINSGNITIDAGRIKSTNQGSESHPYTLSSVTDPYKAFEFLKKVSYDVKTDIEFPNALRSPTNPGYNTKYIADKK